MSEVDTIRAHDIALEFKYPKHVAAPLEPGIYFGLDELKYHNDPALGSTDMKKLASSPCDFWYCSKFNPDWEPEEPTEAQKVGAAMHKCVLEGPAVFDKLYAPAWEPGNVVAGKAERLAIERAGKQFLKGDAWKRIKIASTMIRANPEIGHAFNGAAGTEVSIFWIDANGMRKKARIDCLKFAASVDLKSEGNQMGDPFETACVKSISRYRYDIQAAHYMEGRAHLKAFFKVGKVHGHVPDLMQLREAANVSRHAFIFIFIQKTEAPLTWGTMLSPGNPMLDVATQALRKADENWTDYVNRFGLETPWVRAEPLRELAIESMPAWYARA